MRDERCGTEAMELNCSDLVDGAGHVGHSEALLGGGGAGGRGGGAEVGAHKRLGGLRARARAREREGAGVGGPRE